MTSHSSIVPLSCPVHRAAEAGMNTSSSSGSAGPAGMWRWGGMDMEQLVQAILDDLLQGQQPVGNTSDRPIQILQDIFTDAAANNNTPSACDSQSSTNPHFFHALYVLILCVALVANGTTLYIIGAHRKMRTAVNALVAGLCASNLLLAATMPFTTNMFLPASARRQTKEGLLEWAYGAALCQIVPFAYVLAQSSKVMLLVAIAGERYAAIAQPLRPRAARLAAARPASCVIIFLTAAVTTLVFSIPALVVYTYKPVQLTNHTLYACLDRDLVTLDQYEWTRHYFVYVIPIMEFLLPALLLVSIYSAIICNIRSHARHSSRAIHPHTDINTTDKKKQLIKTTIQQRNQKKAIVMIGVLLFCFLLCFAPINLNKLVTGRKGCYTEILDVLFYLNTVTDPLLHALLVDNYKYYIVNGYMCNKKKRMRMRIKRYMHKHKILQASNSSPTSSKT